MRRRESLTLLSGAAVAWPLAARARPRTMRKPRITGRSRTAQRPGDSCGCAMGAKFMALGLLAGAAWYGLQLYAGEASLGGAVARVLGVTFVAMGAGKIVGILQHRWRGRAPRNAT